MRQNKISKLGLEAEVAKLKIKGLSVRQISKTLSQKAGEIISPSTVWRYFSDNHDPVRKAVVKRVEIAERGINSGLDVVEQLKEINDVARSVLLSTIAEGEYSIAMQAMKRIQEQLELQGKLLSTIVGDPVKIVVKWEEPYEDKNSDNPVQTIQETA